MLRKNSRNTTPFRIFCCAFLSVLVQVGGYYLNAVFRIWIPWVLIRIQHFTLNTDPDPIRIQGFDDLMTKIEIIYSWKENWSLFDQKLQFTYPLASIKGVQAIGEAFSPQKGTSVPALQNMKFLNFFLFLWVIFALLDLDLDPLTWLNPDPVQFRNTG